MSLIIDNIVNDSALLLLFVASVVVPFFEFYNLEILFAFFTHLLDRSNESNDTYTYTLTHIMQTRAPANDVTYISTYFFI